MRLAQKLMSVEAGAHLVMMHPPSRCHNLGVPGSTAADTGAASLRYAPRRKCLLRFMVFDDGGGCTMQISMHIQVSLSASTSDTVSMHILS